MTLLEIFKIILLVLLIVCAIGVNMIGTMVIVIFMVLTVLLKEAYLPDIALIYALISFVSVLIFSAVYIKKKKGAR